MWVTLHSIDLADVSIGIRNMILRNLDQKEG